MKFRNIGGKKIFRNWNLFLEDEYIIGKFTGSSTDNFGKQNYHIEIIETNQDYDPEHHYIPTRGKNKGKKVFDTELPVGETIALNGNGSLDYKMESVNEGEIVKITYKGTDTLPEDHQYAGSDYHVVEVEVAIDESGESASEGDNLDSFTQL